MYKNCIIAFLLILIISYIAFETFNISRMHNIKSNDTSLQYYDNKVSNNVLSNYFKKSSTLEQELVETMNTQFYRDHKPESPSFQALLPSLEGTTNID